MSEQGMVPQHVAIIMDGNGRWAKKRGLPRLKGHEEGANSVRAALRACQELGVKYLTLYAFSVENWVRPPSETEGLMRLLRRFLAEEEHELHEQEVRLRVIGRLEDLPRFVRYRLKRVMRATESYTKGHLILALSYGSRTEIVEAVRQIAEKVDKGVLKPGTIDESTVAAHLYAPDVPDPDFMIRTSGEMRLSNFLLWQLSYSELYVTDVLWPDFREAEFKAAIESYGQRNRRFGDIESKSSSE
jgi:undecaprenyl diphosphate synthase